MKMWSDDRCAWLALYLVPGLGNSGFRNLLDEFGSPHAIFEAELPELTKVAGIRREIAVHIVNREFSANPERELEGVEECDARVITYRDQAYPSLLREINSPPMVLYAKGKDVPSIKMFISVVGSRHPTHYGLKAADRIGRGLAMQGVGVSSGLAVGIDSAAHWGCLAGSGFTVAVLGTGIDVSYPASNRRLRDEISERGTLISEFPLGSPPEPKNFPIRNRIISGLSRGVVVVEATMKSGSLITASRALDQGRDVFAVPGSIDSFKSTGTHFLIKQGAKLVVNADDVLEEFGFAPLSADEEVSPQASLVELGNMEPSEKTIYEIIGEYPVHIDHIVRMADMDPGEVSGVLMKMELKGLIRQQPGKMFTR
jgi:DNA processing protein